MVGPRSKVLSEWNLSAGYLCFQCGIEMSVLDNVRTRASLGLKFNKIWWALTWQQRSWANVSIPSSGTWGTGSSKLPPKKVETVQIMRVGISWSAHLMKNKCLLLPGFAFNGYVLLPAVTSRHCNIYICLSRKTWNRLCWSQDNLKDWNI